MRKREGGEGCRNRRLGERCVEIGELWYEQVTCSKFKSYCGTETTLHRYLHHMNTLIKSIAQLHDYPMV